MRSPRRFYWYFLLFLPLAFSTAHAANLQSGHGDANLTPMLAIPSLNPGVQALNRMQIYAAQAIADVIEGQAALHDKNIIALDADLTKTQVMLELIRSRLPGAEFLAMVRAMRAKMRFEDNEQVLPFFAHLFYALDDMGSNDTVKKARLYLTRAQHALEVPDKADALTALRNSASGFENPLIFPPLKAASDNLQQAFTALNSGNNDVSESLLKALVRHLEALHRAFATYPLKP